MAKAKSRRAGGGVGGAGQGSASAHATIGCGQRHACCRFLAVNGTDKTHLSGARVRRFGSPPASRNAAAVPTSPAATAKNASKARPELLPVPLPLPLPVPVPWGADADAVAGTAAAGPAAASALAAAAAAV